jgi:hypothetical protein
LGAKVSTAVVARAVSGAWIGMVSMGKLMGRDGVCVCAASDSPRLRPCHIHHPTKPITNSANPSTAMRGINDP